MQALGEAKFHPHPSHWNQLEREENQGKTFMSQTWQSAKEFASSKNDLTALLSTAHRKLFELRVTNISFEIYLLEGR